MESENPGQVKHVTSLDGIRALCILAVMGHHCGYCEPGWIGVEMFFVLSGFLITTLMCQENRKTGMISVPRFWARRAFRLLPIYWLYIGVVTIAVLLRRPGDWSATSTWTPGWYIASLWGYFVNFAPPQIWIHQGANYHLWSLALEEQFYLCWPFLFIIALKLKRPWMLPFLIFVVAIIPRIANLPPYYAWLMTYPPIGIVVGCTVGLLYYFNRETQPFNRLISTPYRYLATLMCVICLAILELTTHKWGDSAVRPWADRLMPLYAVPFAMLIAGLWYGEPSGLGRILSAKPLVYLGRISYGMYLYHLVLIGVVKQDALRVSALTGHHIRFAVVVMVYMACVIGVASLSYYFIEKPFLQIGARFRGRPKSVVPDRSYQTVQPYEPAALVLEVES